MRAVITSYLSYSVGPEWRIYEETPMARTGLVLRPTALTTIDQATAGLGPGVGRMMATGFYFPDFSDFSLKPKPLTFFLNPEP